MKDPAFLFYPQDFITGTMFMDYEQVGKYIKLLCAQHQCGGFIDKQSFNKIVGTDELLKSKFIENEDGFYNERLKNEMLKRSKKSNNLSANAKNRWINEDNNTKSNTNAMQMHSICNANALQMDMPSENENENNSLKEEDSKGETKNPTETEVLEYGNAIELSEEESKKFYLIYESQSWKTAGEHPRRFNWRAKMKLYKLELQRKARDETLTPHNKNNGKTLESILQQRQ